MPDSEGPEVRRLGPPVRAVYRVTLPERDGQITLGELRGARAYTFPIGTSVVLEVGAGVWMARDDIEELGATLVGVDHVSLTGTAIPWGTYGTSDEHAVGGLDRIAQAIQGAVHRAMRRMRAPKEVADEARHTAA